MSTQDGILEIHVETLRIATLPHDEEDAARYRVTGTRDIDLIITVFRAYTIGQTISVSLVIEKPNNSCWDKGSGLSPIELAALTCFARDMLRQNGFLNEFVLSHDDGDTDNQYYLTSASR